MKSVVVSTTGTDIPGSVFIGNTSLVIQNAIDYVNSQGGGSVHLLKGVYNITTPIKMKSNIELHGDGINTVLHSTVSADSENACINVVGTSTSPIVNASIHDLKITSPATALSGFRGIWLNYVGLTSPTILDNTRFNTSLVGIKGNANLFGISIYNCDITKNKSFAIIADYVGLSDIHDNNLSYNGEHGIYFRKYNNLNKIYNNIITNNTTAGIQFDKSSNNIIDSNVVKNNAGYGNIWLFETSDRNIISHNIVANNAGFGILIQGSRFNTVSSNIAQNNGSSGIICHTNANENTVTSNTSQNNGDHGFQCYINSLNIFTGNTSQNNGGNGVYFQSSSNVKNTFIGNTIHSSTFEGSNAITTPNK